MWSFCFQAPGQVGLWMKLRSKCLADSFTGILFPAMAAEQWQASFRQYSPEISGECSTLAWFPGVLTCTVLKRKPRLGKDPEDFQRPGRLIGQCSATAVQHHKLSDPLPSLNQTVQVFSSHGCTHIRSLCSAWGVRGQPAWTNNWQCRKKKTGNVRGGTAKWAGDKQGGCCSMLYH